MHTISMVIEHKLRKLLQVSQLKNEDNLFHAGLDSVRLMLLIADLEETFQMTFHHDELKRDSFRTLQALTELISSKQESWDVQ